MCPGIFNHTWTVVDICNQRNASSLQTTSLYDVCPPYACGRNETAPHGVCTFGTCQCNSPHSKNNGMKFIPKEYDLHPNGFHTYGMN